MTTDEKTVLITGSTDGLGRRVAERLAGSGMTVLVHGRDRKRGAETTQAILDAGGKAAFYMADLSVLSEVHRLAAAIRHQHPRLDVLINNAGIGAAGAYTGRCESPDGFELRFAVNYLAGFLLTRLLLPAMESRGNARIINVASAGQQPIDFSDVMLKKHYSGVRAYCQSKLAQILFTFDLARELSGTGITVNALHPATYMDTGMVRGDGIIPATRVEEGADAVLNLALSSALNGQSGQYFDGLRISRALAQAYDADACQKLRDLSFSLTGLTDPLS